MSVSISDPMVTQRYRVQKAKRETHDTYTLELEPAVGKDGFSFTPGQFNMLYAFGVGEAPISISGDPTRAGNLVHTIRAVGKVSKALASMKKGDIIGVRGPFGSHWPVEKTEGYDVVIITGGIGLAPLRPAIYYFLANREKYGRISILYGARTPDEILFPKELESWRGRFDLEVRVTVDTAPSGYRGNVALVTALIPKATIDPYHAVALVCGPEIMMRFTLPELRKRGLEDKNIYVSMERNMKCGIGHCGHCQFGPFFICKDGPVFRYEDIRKFFERREV
jgi:NAD(P)H-flavin reductase